MTQRRKRNLVSARPQNGQGMVTAELAVATLAALAVLTMLCWGIYLVVMQMRIIDTAGEVARQAARADTAAVARAERDAPAGATVRVTSGAAVTSVQVRLTARPFASWLVSVPLHAEADVVPEPAAGER
jgi:hypothetical protein